MSSVPASTPLPLDGLRIVDLSTYVAGPSGGMTLAQLGADVIRVDPVGGATDTLRLPRDAKGHSLYWASLNRGKRSIEVDLRSAEGRDLVGRLLAAPGEGAGILLTNAGGLPWLDYETLTVHRPDLIKVSITGLSDGSPAVDYTVNCEVGLPLLTGPADSGQPTNHVLPAWDLLAGLHAAVAILAAERARARTGRGQDVTLSLADVAVATMCNLGFVADVVANGSGRQRDGNYLYGSFGCDFETLDRRRVMVAALTKRQWQALVEVAGVGEPVAALERALGVDLSREEVRYEYREVLAGLVRPWFARRTLDEVVEALGQTTVLWGVYRDLEEFVADPSSLLNRSRIVEQVEHPGIGTLPTPGSVLDVAGLDGLPPGRAPVLGEHTDEVLRSLLDLDDAAIAELQHAGVIGEPWT